MAYFNKVNTKQNFPQLESKIIDFWEKEKIFEKSITSRSESKRWTFLDGPPFITGSPHYGSLLSSIPKDVFPRFWTMKGYRVRRVWGWDCHGLPAENKVENKLGIKRKKDIEEKIGVKRFIEECKNYVSEVSGEWKWYIDHIARWVDFENAYRTMDRDYMETVMWVFKSMYEKNLIYKGLRVSLYCPHCSTPISNFEVAMDPDNYKAITEPANTYKYKVQGEENTYFLAWSTTPWNKIATPALAVNPKLAYVKVEQGREYYILAKKRLEHLNAEPEYKIVEEMKGADLVGKKFEPHWDYYKIEPGKQAFVIIPGDFVTAEEGTGIVTIAAYGEDDLAAMEKNNIQIVMHVDEEGHLKPDVPKWGGLYYLKVNKLVNEDLEKRGLIYKEEPLTHTVPTCWRCGTRLIYAPQDAWFVDIQSLKPKLFDNNEKVNWIPKHFKHGRFTKSMESAPDWCISRSRYWGSPVPVWECECGERFVPGSIAELEKLSGQKITDLHKPEIDDVTIKCTKCGGVARRVPEVLDSWIEAGSASFAERHYPFNQNFKLEDFFPPDFIVEYTGQIRAWFYVLHVIATALYDSNAFKNVVVTGVILGTDGRKMSKNWKNYPDPKNMLETYGGDALRLYLLGSPVMKGEDILISEDEYRDQIKNFSLPLWNVYNFFVTYANLDNWKPGENKAVKKSKLDLWAINAFHKMLGDLTHSLESYDTPTAVNIIQTFLNNNLSGWFIRRSRERLGIWVNNEDDKLSFYETAYFILTNFCKAIAPIVPLISEEIYRNLTKEQSVHLTDWPKAGEIDTKLLRDMEYARIITEKAHAIRKEKGIAVRQPLPSLKIISDQDALDKEILEIVKAELNVKKIIWEKGKILELKLDTKITPTLKEEAKTRELVRAIQVERKNLGIGLTTKVKVINPWFPKNENLLQWLMQKTGTTSLEKGDFAVKKA